MRKSSLQETIGSGLEIEIENDSDESNISIKQDAETEPLERSHILLLDLDETIIRSSKQKPTFSDYGEAKPVTYNAKDETCQIYVILRPYLKEFLAEVSQKYKIYIYTASAPEYAEACIKNLELSNYLDGIFSRNDCKKSGDNSFEKDIFSFGFDESKLVFIDDWKSQTTHAPNNSINIKFFNGRRSDSELLKLKEFLIDLSEGSDVRCVADKFDKYRAKSMVSCSEAQGFLTIRQKLLACESV
jgi:Dullard-like phosphatase family protein